MSCSSHLMRGRRVAAAVVALTLLAAAGCGSSEEDGAAPQASSEESGIDPREDLAEAADSAGHPDQYTIGVISGFSGPGAIYGEYSEQGIEMFTEAIGGELMGREIVFETEDNQNLPDRTPAAFQNLVSRSEPDVLFMGNTPSILALLPEFESRPLVNMNTGGVSPTLAGLSPMVVNLIPLIDQEATALAEYVTGELDIRTVAGITTNDEFGQTTWASFTPALEDAGGEAVGNVEVSLGATDFRAAVSELVALEPDAIYTGVYGNPLTNFIRQVRQAGFEGPIIGASILQIQATLEAGAAAEGMVMTALQPNPEASDYARYFTERFEEKYDEKPSLYAGAIYDGLNMWAQAVTLLAEQGKDPSAENLVAALHEIGTFPSVFGESTELSDDNTVAANVSIVQVEGGEFETVQASE